MSSKPTPGAMALWAQQNQNDLLRGEIEGRKLKWQNEMAKKGIFDAQPGSNNNGSSSSFNSNIKIPSREELEADRQTKRREADEDARKAMLLRREETDHQIDRDFTMGEHKRNNDNSRDMTNFKFRQDATEAAADRLYQKEKGEARNMKSEIGWTR